MEFKKWGELDKKKKVILGIGTAVVAVAAGTGISAAVLGGEPAKDAKAMTKTNTHSTSGKDKNKSTGKTSGKDTKADTKKTTTAKAKKTGKTTHDKKTVTKTENKNGKTKTVTKTTGSKTPKATVKVKSSKGSSSTASKSSTGSSSKKSTSSKSGSTHTTTKHTVAKHTTSTSKPSTRPSTTASKPSTRPSTTASKPSTSSSTTYLSASQANQILSGSGLFKKSGNEYYMVNSWGIDMLKVTVGSNHVTRVFFDGREYYSIKAASKQDYIDALGQKRGEEEYAKGREELREIESAIRAAANAVYGPGNSKANALYNEILKGGKSRMGYGRSF
jgi:hypothetical protein